MTHPDLAQWLAELDQCPASAVEQPWVQELYQQNPLFFTALSERQRWQLLMALGEALAELEAGLRQEAAATGVNQGAAQCNRAAGGVPGSQPTPSDDLDSSWARFEADQELEQLRRRQQG